MNKRSIVWIILIGVLIGGGWYWFRGTPDSQVPYPDLSQAKVGKGLAHEGRPIPYHEIFLAWRNYTDLHLIIYNDVNKPVSKEVWEEFTAHPEKIADEFGCDKVIFNGPRFWVLDKIEAQTKTPMGSIQGHEMEIPAFFTMSMESMKSRKPYETLAMNRHTKYTYDANKELYILTDDQGRQFVMQAASQEILKDVEIQDLAGLSSRFKSLPEGWTYKVKVISEPFINISNGRTTIVQDEFRNTYQIATDIPN